MLTMRPALLARIAPLIARESAALGEEVVDEPLLREEVEVERVSVNRVVEEPSGIRYEGDRTIIPLYEEVLVVEKRLMLTEELHVTKRQVETRDPQRVSLRREEAVVERKEES
jgi:uncharacterized protein (TIGR02271 family)